MEARQAPWPWKPWGFVLLVWLCFLLRGFFYASVFPLWEGYDEWAHFAYVQHLAAHGELPLAAKTLIAREVQESLRLVPLPWTDQQRRPEELTHDAYWKLSARERELRQERLHSLPIEWARQPAAEASRLYIYEAQQPPLYYWLLSWPLRLVAEASLTTRVIILRWLSVLLASLLIPLGFLLARRVFGHDGLAIGTVALVSAMPELMVDVCRVGNDSVAIVLYSLLLYLSLELVERPESDSLGRWLGVVLGMGLLTKAYFLSALPAVTLIFIWALWHRTGQRRKVLFQGVGAALPAILIAGWWYWRNQLVSGSWVWQIHEVAVRDLPLASLLRRAFEVNWMEALDTIFVSHIWFGNWSFLQVRSWMYDLFRLIVLLAALGLLIAAVRHGRNLKSPAASVLPGAHLPLLFAFYGFFWLGLAYHVLIIFVIHGVSASNGWYLYSLVVAEVILATAGLLALFPTRWGRWILPAGTACFALLELYATHFLLIPYYSGLIVHKADGALASFHVYQLRQVGLGTVLMRLEANKPGFVSSPVLIVLWLLFLVGTTGLVVLALCASRAKASGANAGRREN